MTRLTLHRDTRGVRNRFGRAGGDDGQLHRHETQEGRGDALEPI